MAGASREPEAPYRVRLSGRPPQQPNSDHGGDPPMLSGDEEYGDDITSGPINDDEEAPGEDDDND